MHTLRSQTAWAIGGLLVALGLIGFVSPGLHSNGMLIGFIPDTSRNLLYLAAGAVGVFTIFERDAFTHVYLMAVGALFVALAFDGFIWDGGLFNLFPVLPVDAYFHALIGTVALVIAVWEEEKKRRR